MDYSEKHVTVFETKQTPNVYALSKWLPFLKHINKILDENRTEQKVTYILNMLCIALFTYIIKCVPKVIMESSTELKLCQVFL